MKPFRMTDVLTKVDLPEGSRGPWTIQRFEIPRGPDLQNLRLHMDGRGAEPGIYTKLIHSKKGLMMSDTTAEQRDHREFIYQARGHVLITGLGLGMCVGACLRKPEVELLTVIEICPDLIELVEPHYRDPRLEVINADAWQYKPPKGLRYDVAWHDIWGDVSTDVLREMGRLLRRYPAAWKDCWARSRLQRQKQSQRGRWPWR